MMARRSLPELLAARVVPATCQSPAKDTAETPADVVTQLCESMCGMSGLAGVAKPLHEVMYADMAKVLAMGGKDITIRVTDSPAMSLQSWFGCAQCGSHALVVGGDWLVGDEEVARRSHLRACSKCVRAFYCGRDCQRAHWARHKSVCKVWPALDISLVDLGHSPSDATKAAAVAEFERQSAIVGATMSFETPRVPIPSFVDVSGYRQQL